jgi:hypothetical protein
VGMKESNEETHSSVGKVISDLLSNENSALHLVFFLTLHCIWWVKKKSLNGIHFAWKY